MPLYTLKVTLCNKDELLFKDLTPDQMEISRKQIWTHGLKRQTNTTTWELISPFVILSAYIIEQVEPEKQKAATQCSPLDEKQVSSLCTKV